MATPTLGGGNLTSADVLAYAQRVAQAGTDVGVNMCQRFVRQAFGSAGGAASAVDAWRQTPIKHTAGTPPPGTAVYWGGGAGHAAISAGNGWVYTTDWDTPGRVSLARIDDITNKWGKPLLGWTTQTNDRKITRMNAQPTVDGAGSRGSSMPVYQGNTTTAGGGVSTEYSRKELRQRYGYVADTYASVPEIQKLVKLAIKGKWTDDEFDRRLQASKWYRKHTEEERQWVVLSASQPGEAQQQVLQKKTDIQNLYRQMGVPVGKARLDELATASVKHGWTEQQLRNAIVGEFDYDPDKTFGGVAGQTVDTLRQMASQYVVPISNKTIDQWTQNVLRGEATPEDFTSYMRDQAKSLFPALSDAIDKGVTVDQYLDPYRQMASKELEINPEDIDWTEPKWSDIVFRTTQDGKRGVMSLADAQKTMRTDPRFGYDKTSQARDQAATLASQIGQMFGRVG